MTAPAAVFRRAATLRADEEAIARAVGPALSKLRATLADLIRTWPFDEVSVGRQQARYDALMVRADEAIKAAYTQLSADVRERVVALGAKHGARATDELARLAGLDTATLAVPTRRMMRSILSTDPVQGEVMGKWWREQARTTARAFRTQMRLGLMRQEGVADLVKRVRGTPGEGGRLVGGIMQASARGAEALVRTTVNEVANKAALAAYSQDPDVSEAFEFVATLDDRTTEECQAADGQVFRYDDPAALVPPLHWNCRSTIVPVIKYKELGLTPPAEERLTYKEWQATQ